MLFTSLIVFLLTTSCFCKEIIVTINDGQIKGQVVQFNNFAIDVFKGIRFGKPPIGDLRFKRPEKVEKWTYVYDATTDKYSCWQIDFGYDKINKHEDCLFLNVWAPHNSSGNKPIMVWFYGGALQMGTIFHPLYDAIPITTFDVIVVAINYRVGPMGFLYDGTEEAPGNVGLYNQLLGLKWVRNILNVNSSLINLIKVQANFDNFGDNPNDVTIFGESAGGISVRFHVLSPLSKELFKKAIIQSGTAHTDAFFMDKSQALNVSKTHAHEVGCNHQIYWMTCLKKLDASIIYNYTFDIFHFMKTKNFLPVVGEAFYPVKSYDAFK